MNPLLRGAAAACAMLLCATTVATKLRAGLGAFQ